MDEVATGVGGSRLRWADLPGATRAALERELGGEVVEAHSQPGGFSPGLASRVVLADGRRAFVKAAGPDPAFAVTARFLRREARVMSGLPAGLPVPELSWCHDDGDWVAIGLSDVEGHQPAQPWRPDELALVLDAVGELSDRLTPSPADLAPATKTMREMFTGWRDIVADPALVSAVDDPWAAANLGALAGLESGWEPAVAGNTLLHGDLRADNLLVTASGVVVVDWPHACVGPRWLDLLMMLPSVAMQGGPPPERVWRAHPVTAGARPEQVDAVLAAVAGFFVHRSLQPAPERMPRIRAFQRAQGRTALDWLRARTS